MLLCLRNREGDQVLHRLQLGHFELEVHLQEGRQDQPMVLEVVLVGIVRDLHLVLLLVVVEVVVLPQGVSSLIPYLEGLQVETRHHQD